MKHNTKTEWRAIPGYEGLYCISEFGDVMSYPKGHYKTTRFLRGYTTIQGYRIVGLSKKGKRQWNLGVHRLVALAFIGPCPDDKEVNHIDGDPSNNHVSNLEYVTHAENMQHMHDLHKINNARIKRRVAETKVKDIPNGFIMPVFGLLHTNTLQK